MKTRIKYLQFNIAFLIIFVMGDASGQSATLTSNFTNESAVRSSQHQIQVTVSGDSIQPAIGSDNGAADTFLSGFSGGSIAFYAMIDALDATDIFLSSDSTIATIVVPSTGSYYIDSDENISFTIPSASLVVTEQSVRVTVEDSHSRLAPSLWTMDRSLS